MIDETADVVHINHNSQTKEKINEISNKQRLIDDIETIFQQYTYWMYSKTKVQMLYNIIFHDQNGVFKGKVHGIFDKNVLSGKFDTISKPWKIFQAID